MAALPYVGLQKAVDDIAPWGSHACEEILCLQELSEDAISVLSENIPRKSSLSFITILSLGGAFTDVGEQETAFGGSRQTRFVVNMTTIAPDAELLDVFRMNANIKPAPLPR